MTVLITHMGLLPEMDIRAASAKAEISLMILDYNKMITKLQKK